MPMRRHCWPSWPVTEPRSGPGRAANGPGRQTRPSGPQWATFARTVALAAVLLGMTWLVFNVEVPSVAELRDGLQAWGVAAWAVFILAYALVALTPIPVTIMAVTAGVLFNLVQGAVLSVIGVLIGSWGAYWLARWLGGPTVERLLGRHGPRVRDHLDRGGFAAVYTLRLMPGVPYWPVNYGSGAFGVGQRDYVIASVIAVIPGQVSLVAIGAFVVDPSLVRGIVVAATWILVVAMTIWAFRSWKGTSTRPLPGMKLR